LKKLTVLFVLLLIPSVGQAVKGCPDAIAGYVEWIPAREGGREVIRAYLTPEGQRRWRQFITDGEMSLDTGQLVGRSARDLKWRIDQVKQELERGYRQLDNPALADGAVKFIREGEGPKTADLSTLDLISAYLESYLPPYEWEKVEEAHAALANRLGSYLDGNPQLTPSELVSWITKWMRRYGRESIDWETLLSDCPTFESDIHPDPEGRRASRKKLLTAFLLVAPNRLDRALKKKLTLILAEHLPLAPDHFSRLIYIEDPELFEAVDLWEGPVPRAESIVEYFENRSELSEILHLLNSELLPS
jgi:hypothetical protein